MIRYENKDNNWKLDIRFTPTLTIDELNRWCAVYGEKKYKEYYVLTKKAYPKNKVPLGALRECVIYDMHLSKELFGIMRIVEYGLRNEVLLHIEEEKFANNLYNILSKMPKNEKPYAKSYEDGNIDLYGYLQSISFGSLKLILNYMIEQSKIEMDYTSIETINSFRNDIMHHRLILSENIDNVRNKIEMLLSFIYDTNLRNKRTAAINKLVHYNGKTVRNYVVKVGV